MRCIRKAPVPVARLAGVYHTGAPAVVERNKNVITSCNEPKQLRELGEVYAKQLVLLFGKTPEKAMSHRHSTEFGTEFV
jgi:hypothetical protein